MAYVYVVIRAIDARVLGVYSHDLPAKECHGGLKGWTSDAKGGWYRGGDEETGLRPTIYIELHEVHEHS